MKCNKLLGDAFVTLHPSTEKGGISFSDLMAKDEITGFKYHYAIEDLTEWEYQSLANYYRHGKSEGEHVEKIAAVFDEMFTHEGNWNGNSYRATRIDTDKLDRLRVGQLIQNNSILSTTSKKEKVEDFFKMRIDKDAPKSIENSMFVYEESSRPWKDTTKTVVHFDNSRNPGYDIHYYSAVPDEKEVLIAPNSVLRVNKIETQNGTKHLYLSQIPKKEENMLAKKKGGIRGYTGILSLTALAPIIYEEKEDGM